jgi:hypothetical protein
MFLVLSLSLLTFASVQTELPVIKPGEADKIAKYQDKPDEVLIEGKVESARWSDSGKVLSIKFEGVEVKQFSSILFEQNRKRFDDAFSGDFAKTITGAHVRFRGKITSWKGRDGDRPAQPQLVLETASSVTIEVK